MNVTILGLLYTYLLLLADVLAADSASRWLSAKMQMYLCTFTSSLAAVVPQNRKGTLGRHHLLKGQYQPEGVGESTHTFLQPLDKLKAERNPAVRKEVCLATKDF